MLQTCFNSKLKILLEIQNPVRETEVSKESTHYINWGWRTNDTRAIDGTCHNILDTPPNKTFCILVQNISVIDSSIKAFSARVSQFKELGEKLKFIMYPGTTSLELVPIRLAGN
ncbi:hypothetical protein TNCV_308101 [Trichonephila clavipes]|nr:hypothetical protein TNCV_308101 [Trichonephila clavipes]